MISEMAYKTGSEAAWATFTKTAGGAPVMSFPKKPPMAAPAMPAPVAAAPAMKPPVMGGAAAPAAPAGGAPAVAPAAGGGWKGLAKDVAVQAAVPLGIMGLQSMMSLSAPKDPNAVG